MGIITEIYDEKYTAITGIFQCARSRIHACVFLLPLEKWQAVHNIDTLAYIALNLEYIGNCVEKVNYHIDQPNMYRTPEDAKQKLLRNHRNHRFTIGVYANKEVLMLEMEEAKEALTQIIREPFDPRNSHSKQIQFFSNLNLNLSKHGISQVIKAALITENKTHMQLKPFFYVNESAEKIMTLLSMPDNAIGNNVNEMTFKEIKEIESSLIFFIIVSAKSNTLKYIIKKFSRPLEPDGFPINMPNEDLTGKSEYYFTRGMSYLMIYFPEITLLFLNWIGDKWIQQYFSKKIRMINFIEKLNMEELKPDHDTLMEKIISCLEPDDVETFSKTESSKKSLVTLILKNKLAKSFIILVKRYPTSKIIPYTNAKYNQSPNHPPSDSGIIAIEAIKDFINPDNNRDEIEKILGMTHASQWTKHHFQARFGGFNQDIELNTLLKADLDNPTVDGWTILHLIAKNRLPEEVSKAIHTLNVGTLNQVINKKASYLETATDVTAFDLILSKLSENHDYFTRGGEQSVCLLINKLDAKTLFEMMTQQTEAEAEENGSLVVRMFKTSMMMMSCITGNNTMVLNDVFWHSPWILQKLITEDISINKLDNIIHFILLKINNKTLVKLLSICEEGRDVLNIDLITSIGNTISKSIFFKMMKRIPETAFSSIPKSYNKNEITRLINDINNMSIFNCSPFIADSIAIDAFADISKEQEDRITDEEEKQENQEEEKKKEEEQDEITENMKKRNEEYEKNEEDEDQSEEDAQSNQYAEFSNNSESATRADGRHVVRSLLPILFTPSNKKIDEDTEIKVDSEYFLFLKNIKDTEIHILIQRHIKKLLRSRHTPFEYKLRLACSFHNEPHEIKTIIYNFFYTSNTGGFRKEIDTQNEDFVISLFHLFSIKTNYQENNAKNIYTLLSKNERKKLENFIMTTPKLLHHLSLKRSLTLHILNKFTYDILSQAKPEIIAEYILQVYSSDEIPDKSVFLNKLLNLENFEKIFIDNNILMLYAKHLSYQHFCEALSRIPQDILETELLKTREEPHATGRRYNVFDYIIQHQSADSIHTLFERLKEDDILKKLSSPERTQHLISKPSIFLSYIQKFIPIHPNSAQIIYLKSALEVMDHDHYQKILNQINTGAISTQDHSASTIKEVLILAMCFRTHEKVIEILNLFTKESIQEALKNTVPPENAPAIIFSMAINYNASPIQFAALYQKNTMFLTLLEFINSETLNDIIQKSSHNDAFLNYILDIFTKEDPAGKTSKDIKSKLLNLMNKQSFIFLANFILHKFNQDQVLYNLEFIKNLYQNIFTEDNSVEELKDIIKNLKTAIIPFENEPDQNIAKEIIKMMKENKILMKRVSLGFRHKFIDMHYDYSQHREPLRIENPTKHQAKFKYVHLHGSIHNISNKNYNPNEKHDSTKKHSTSLANNTLSSFNYCYEQHDAPHAGYFLDIDKCTISAMFREDPVTYLREHVAYSYRDAERYFIKISGINCTNREEFTKHVNEHPTYLNELLTNTRVEAFKAVFCTSTLKIDVEHAVELQKLAYEKLNINLPIVCFDRRLNTISTIRNKLPVEIEPIASIPIKGITGQKRTQYDNTNDSHDKAINPRFDDNPYIKRYRIS